MYMLLFLKVLNIFGWRMWWRGHQKRGKEMRQDQLYLECSFLFSFSKGFKITKFAQVIYENILLAKKQNIQDKAQDFFDRHFPSW